MDALTAYLLIACALAVGFFLGRKSGEPMAPPAPPDGEALEAVRPIYEAEGKIAAIRAYRERTHTGLRDAKAAVDTLDRA
jgi:ribosomal protein L7/L12